MHSLFVSVIIVKLKYSPFFWGPPGTPLMCARITVPTCPRVIKRGTAGPLRQRSLNRAARRVRETRGGSAEGRSAPLYNLLHKTSQSVTLHPDDRDSRPADDLRQNEGACVVFLR